MNATSLLTMLLASFIGGLGDVLCRHAASRTDQHDIVAYTAGAATCWALGSLIWLQIYRTRSILEMVIVYTPFHSVALGLAGIFIFGDAFTPRLVLAAILSIAAVWVMS